MGLLDDPLPRPLEDSSPGSVSASSRSPTPGVGGVGDARGAVNVPMQLVSDCQGRVVTVELTSREVYRGRLAHFDKDSMNVGLQEVTVTKERDHSCARLQSVYLRGDKMRFILLPEAANTHPLWKEVDEMLSKPRPIRDLVATTGRGGAGRGGRNGGRFF